MTNLERRRGVPAKNPQNQLHLNMIHQGRLSWVPDPQGIGLVLERAPRSLPILSLGDVVSMLILLSTSHLLVLGHLKIPKTPKYANFFS